MDFKFILSIIPEVLAALPVTLALAFFAGIMGWVLGFILAILRSKKKGIVRNLCSVVVSFFRGVPTVVLLYVTYFTLPQLFPSFQLRIPAFFYALFALGLNQAAYASENFLSALSSVNSGQMEAAYSVNMTKLQCMLHIILPQALVAALPNMGNMFLGLVQETSLAFYVGVTEITSKTHYLADAGLNFLEGYVVLTIIYEVLSLVLGKAFSVVENRISVYRWRPCKQEIKTALR